MIGGCWQILYFGARGGGGVNGRTLDLYLRDLGGGDRFVWSIAVKAPFNQVLGFVFQTQVTQCLYACAAGVR